LLSFGACLIALVVAERMITWVPFSDGQDRLAAAALAQRAQAAIKAEKLRRGLTIDPHDDPAGTGLIGPRTAALVTEKADLSAKQAATNPNFAAPMVGMLHRLGVQRGDPVAVSLTGSIPGANLAVLCALQVVGAKTVVIASLGSSAWGATDPEFTWLDMASLLKAQGILDDAYLAATPGGKGDGAGGLPVESLDLMRAAAHRNQVHWHVPSSLTGAVDYRRNAFVSAFGVLPKVFINIGGGAASYGTRLNGVSLRTPLLQPSLAPALSPHGLIHQMLKEGVPVITIHPILEAERAVGLPLSYRTSAPLGQPAGLYNAKQHNLPALVGLLIGLVALLIVALNLNRVIPRGIQAAPEEPSATPPAGEESPSL
jgi:poly-gamma-glutamate system protein